ncbi:FxLYD domain-containing protein [Streptomyces sp. NPDC056387]|uniref:FxLYD domain-containing protein n=1 Tax=Streptomyces sp. NPDC056387 TaxID=3345803 RepID=UPI0035D85E76
MSQQYPQPDQPQAGWGTPPQGPPPKKAGAGKIVGLSCLGVVGLVIVIGIAGAVVGGTPKKETTPPAAASSQPGAAVKPADSDGANGDAQIKSCEVDSDMGWAKAELTITNRSSKTSNYMIQVEFVDETGTRLGEAIAATNNLAPGQAAQQTAQGLDQIKGKITCKVTKVTRYAS